VKREKGAAVFVALLVVISLARLFLVSAQPINDDAAVYAEMAREAFAGLPLVPHYLGNPVAWKPPAGIYLYAAAATAAEAAWPQIPLEIALRLGPALASIACAFALFAIARRLFGNEAAFLSAVAFLTASETLAVANGMLLDTAFLLFALLALYAYMRSFDGRSWLWVASAFAVLAALTKTYAALLIPLLAISYYLSRNPKRMRSPAFIASLFAAPAAMLAYALLFALIVPNGLREIAASYIYDSLGRVFMSAPGLLSNATDIFRMLFPWSVLVPAGVVTLRLRKAEDMFLLMWFCISLITLLGKPGYFWYYLPLVPPAALLSVRALSLLRPAHMRAAFILCLMVSLANYTELAAPGGNGEQAAVGTFLSHGCGSTLFITERGVPAVAFYKFSAGGGCSYSSVSQMVAEPFGSESYTAFASMWELVMEKYEPNSLANATPRYLGSLAAGYETVVMEKKFYDIYGKEPLPDYSPVFFSPHGDFVVLRRAG
jgi:4-amino-4-deoxy-L-arabinose transferase-like glycosyltransferase